MVPVFEALVDSFDTGIIRISLVDAPAVETDFFWFAKENERQVKFSIDSEEQRMVTGVIMRAGFPIYRYDENIGEYYIKYSKETIKKMAEKMMTDSTFNNINIMHTDGSDVEGVNLVELFIKDTAKGISPAGFENIEDGSLFATYKINNDTIWHQIKDGTFKGFSLEGTFDIEPVKLRNKKTKKYSMSTLFNRFLKTFVKCGSIETDKGRVYWVGEADLEIGDELFYNTENEEAVKVEDGEYTLEDGTKIVVKEGLVSEIRKQDGTQEGELDMEKKTCLEETVIEIPEEGKESYDDLKRDIDDLRKEHDELKGYVEEMRNTLDELMKKPAAEPIVDEFLRTQKNEGIVPKFGSRAKVLH